jgi:hypothetical protein
MREAAASGRSPPEQMRAVGRFYFEHWTRNREYFQIFWALENQAVIGELPPGVVEEVARLWENCLRILADVIERGAKEGTFARCDAWEVANILWTVANGLLQAEHVVSRTRTRRAEDARPYARRTPGSRPDQAAAPVTRAAAPNTQPSLPSRPRRATSRARVSSSGVSGPSPGGSARNAATRSGSSASSANATKKSANQRSSSVKAGRNGAVRRRGGAFAICATLSHASVVVDPHA